MHEEAASEPVRQDSMESSQSLPPVYVYDRGAVVDSIAAVGCAPSLQPMRGARLVTMRDTDCLCQVPPGKGPPSFGISRF